MWKRMRELLAERQGQLPNSAQISGANAIASFSAIIQQQLPGEGREGVHARKLVQGVLSIEVEHPALVQMLRNMERDILQQLNARGNKVCRLAFTVRRRTEEQSAASS
ncbi:MAG: DciA family protein [bacterium]